MVNFSNGIMKLFRTKSEGGKTWLLSNLIIQSDMLSSFGLFLRCGVI